MVIMAVFTTLSLGEKAAGAIAPAGLCAVAQAISQVRQPMHWVLSATIN